MKAFLSLVKCDCIRIFGVNKYARSCDKKQIAKFVFVLLAVLTVCAVVAAVSGLYSFIIITLIPEKPEAPLGIFTLVYFVLGLFFAVSSSSGSVFGSADYDMLASYPIKTQVVVAAKSLSVYLLLFAVGLVTLVPAGTVCLIFAKSGVLSVLRFAFYLIIVPLLPTCLGVAICAVFSWFFARVKNKNFFKLIFSALGLALYLYLVVGFDLEADDDVLINFINAFFTNFSALFFVADGVVFGWAGFAVLVAVCAGVLVAYFAFFVKFYRNINEAIKTKRSRGDFKMQKTEKRGITKSLLFVNFKTLASCPTALLNHAVGPVLMLVLAIYLAVSGQISFFVASAESAGGDAEIVLKYVREYLIYFPVFFLGVSAYTASAISLDAKNLWIIKSSPIKAFDYLKSKIILGMIISFPAGAATQAVLSVCFECSVYEVIASLLFLFVYSLAANSFALFLNLKFPFLDWKSPTEAIKQGTSVMLSCLAGMLIVLPIAALNFACSAITGVAYVGWAVNFLLFALLAAFMINYFLKNGEAAVKRL